MCGNGDGIASSDGKLCSRGMRGDGIIYICMHVNGKNKGGGQILFSFISYPMCVLVVFYMPFSSTATHGLDVSSIMVGIR